MTSKLRQITPAQIKRLLDELPKPDDTARAVLVLEAIPAFDAAVTQHLCGDADEMDDEQFEEFLAACGRNNSRY